MGGRVLGLGGPKDINASERVKKYQGMGGSHLTPIPMVIVLGSDELWYDVVVKC